MWDWASVRSTLASQPPATPLLIPFTPIKHLEVLCTRMLGPQAPLSFHKSSSCLKTMIKITSGQKQPLWNIYSLNPSEVSALLPAAMVEDGLNIFAEERMRRRGEQEVLSLSSLSSCLGLASEVWNPPRAFLPRCADLSSHTPACCYHTHQTGAQMTSALLLDALTTSWVLKWSKTGWM